jgi:pimeloyl-ACP methyl ester carboxylesterase
VIAYDRPAFGLTARPLPGEWTGESPYGPDAQVNMLIGLMDALKIERAIWVGNSAGGGVAALAALRYPSRVDALILVDAAIGGGSNAPWYQPLMTTPQGRRIGPLIARQIKEWGIDFGKSAWHAPSKITPEIWQGYLKPLQVENWDRALWEFTASSRPTELASQIKNITLPTLVITGDDDKIVPKERSIRLANDLPNAKLVVIPNCGHVPHEECPAEFLSAVKNFMGTMR